MVERLQWLVCLHQNLGTRRCSIETLEVVHNMGETRSTGGYNFTMSIIDGVSQNTIHGSWIMDKLFATGINKK